LARSASGASTRLRILEQVIGLTGAEVWSAIEIPKGSTVLAVSLRVTEAITGAASFDCGVWGATDLFGTGIAVSAGAQNVTAITPAVFGADSAIVLTAQGSDFTGGKLVLAIHLLICGAPDAAPA
ncbi:MAG: DUF2793 domain-containing protein, partial [Bacteroidales bacterium]|nr:DUF2793 domain-containing protein [Bacteroidales bacterium]